MLTNLNTNFLVSILIMFFIPYSHQQTCNNQDQASLLALSSSISTSSSPPLNWSSAVTCCSWEGVDCDVNGRVISLQLQARGLKGEINSSIINLVSLTILDLSKNSFSGNLPTELFYSLSNLEILDLSFNNLEGNFSSKSGLPATIRAVNISNNNFQGMIENTLFSDSSLLSRFNISKNRFNGFLPSSICTYSPLLKALDFSYNSFSGSIPRNIGKCSMLEVFRARYNSLSSSIPWEIENLTLLEELNLESNDLRGSIPRSLMNCTNLVTLILRINKLEGEISTLNFSKLVRLQKLDLSRNMFSGPLPESIYSCKTLIALRLASNIYLNGQVSPKIIEMNSLSFLSLTNNSLTNITSTLKILAGCKNLTILLLGYNFYNETLPSNRAFLGSNGFQSLQYLSLVYCNFAGYFPEWIQTITNLRILHLTRNRITGTIPKWLGALPNLFGIDLSENLLSGEFPQELCFLPALVTLNMPNLNHFYFEIPVYSIFPGRNSIYQFNVYPPQISLQNNHISGTIPSEIGKLRNLNMLHLNGNRLSGEIPVQISELTNLEELSLAQNHLTGEIPASLRNLNFLAMFDVSYNDLEGPIPTGGQFDTFQASSYKGNPGLCGQVLQQPCGSKNDQPENDDEGDGKHSFLGGFIIGLASGFSGVLGLVASWAWYKNLYRKSGKVANAT